MFSDVILFYKTLSALNKTYRSSGPISANSINTTVFKKGYCDYLYTPFKCETFRGCPEGQVTVIKLFNKN